MTVILPVPKVPNTENIEKLSPALQLLDESPRSNKKASGSYL